MQSENLDKKRKENLFSKIDFKDNYLKFIFIIVSMVLILPSIRYLFINKTLANFTLFNTWILEKMPVGINTLIDTICFLGLFLILIYIYLEFTKKDKFKSIKQLIIFIAINSIIFGLAIPYMTSDIFYYLGIGWLDANYNENPYYNTVSEKMETVQNDEILDSTGYWNKTTSVYGPTWQLISKVLSFLSFGSVTLGIYMYKLLAIIIHILNCLIIYKICKKKKFVIIYGLNPIILFQMITNVHNDIYVVLFLLLTIYFIRKRKNIWLSLTMLGISVTIKYFTILFFPFLVLYYVQDKKIYQKFLYGIKYFLYLILIIAIPYLFYVRDFSVLQAMFVQVDKYSQSIWCFILTMGRMHGWNINVDIWKKVVYIGLVISYILVLFKYLKLKNIKWSKMMKDYNWVILLFIFLVLTTFQIWYLVWLIPAIMWQKGENIKFYNNLILLSVFPLSVFIYRQSDGYIYGMWQSIAILLLAIVAREIKNKNLRQYIRKIFKTKQECIK